METVVKMPVTLEDRLELSEELRIPASWDEFLDLVLKCDYRIEFDENEIISFMGYGTDVHEKIALKIGHLLMNLLGEDLFEFYGSNLALHIPGSVHKYFNADCVVVKGQAEKVVLRGEMEAVANPVLIVEVLSPSTKDFDLGRKFHHYRKIPSLQQILFIGSTETLVISHTRLEGNNEWLLREFSNLNESIPILQQGAVAMADIYRKISF